eukprot:2627763-Pleurochrysis_carterae.AAC.1
MSENQKSGRVLRGETYDQRRGGEGAREVFGSDALLMCFACRLVRRSHVAGPGEASPMISCVCFLEMKTLAWFELESENAGASPRWPPP